MSRVNLLPPEIRERARIRRRTIAVGAVGAIVLGLLVVFYLLQVMRLSDVEQDLAAQQRENADLEAQIAELREFEELQQQLAGQRDLVQAAVAGEVSWSGILRDLSLIIPTQMWLSDLSGQVALPTEAAPAVGPIVGSIQFTGFAFDTPTIALWLTQLEMPTGWVNAWLSSAQDTTFEGTPVIQFSSSVDLSPEVLGPGGGGQT